MISSPPIAATESSAVEDSPAADTKIPDQLKIVLISLHGLVRSRECELGKDVDTGGQVKYVLELARELAAQPHVRDVELLTRQIIDPRVEDDYAQLEEAIADNARIVTPRLN